MMSESTGSAVEAGKEAERHADRHRHEHRPDRDSRATRGRRRARARRRRGPARRSRTDATRRGPRGRGSGRSRSGRAARAPARAAASTTSTARIPAPTAARPRARRRRTGAHDRHGAHRSPPAEMRGSSHAVEQVGQEVHDDEERRDHEHGALHDGVVALVDRGHGQPADAGQAEQRLDHDRAAEQHAELDPGHRDDRHRGVAQRVAVDDRPLRQALRPQERHERRSERLLHRRRASSARCRPPRRSPG